MAKVYIPSVKVTKSGSNISKIDLRFLLYNSDTNSYEAVTDLTTLKKVATGLFIDLANYGSTTKDSHVKIDLSSADSNGVFSVDSSKFDGTWTDTDISNGGSLATGYEIFGYAMRTEFRTMQSLR